jgi:hypothetical protein
MQAKAETKENEESTDFKMILLKRKQDEMNNPNRKCKVVIKDTVTVTETKADRLKESKEFLEKINSKLSKEEYQQFKIALNNFYIYKKNNDAEKKVKYYKVLRSLFQKDLEFFKEIEKFIQFNGVIKSQNVIDPVKVAATTASINGTTSGTKRKHEQSE